MLPVDKHTRKALPGSRLQAAGSCHLWGGRKPERAALTGMLA